MGVSNYFRTCGHGMGIYGDCKRCRRENSGAGRGYVEGGIGWLLHVLPSNKEYLDGMPQSVYRIHFVSLL